MSNLSEIGNDSRQECCVYDRALVLASLVYIHAMNAWAFQDIQESMPLLDMISTVSIKPAPFQVAMCFNTILNKLCSDGLSHMTCGFLIFLGWNSHQILLYEMSLPWG